MISYQNLISQKGSFSDPFYIAQKQKRLDRNCEDPFKFAAAAAMILIFRIEICINIYISLRIVDTLNYRLAQNIII